jgi:hypothetical protein
LSTWYEIADDIKTTLKSKYDDANITLAHVVYWLRIFGDRLLMQHQQKKDTTTYVQNFHIPANMITPDWRGEKYFVLPQDIFDYDGDNGIEYITYFDGLRYVPFGRTTPGAIPRLYFTIEETPRPDNPYFYRMKDLAKQDAIFLLGFECINVPDLDIGLRTTLTGVIPCNLDEQMPFPDELLVILQNQVLNIGRFVLLTPQDRSNTGTPETEEVTPSQAKVITAKQPQQQIEDTQ